LPVIIGRRLNRMAIIMLVFMIVMLVDVMIGRIVMTQMIVVMA
jgi:hypothetical protein